MTPTSTLPVGSLGWTVEVAPSLARALRTEYHVVVRDPQGVAVRTAYARSLLAAVELARCVVASHGAL